MEAHYIIGFNLWATGGSTTDVEKVLAAPPAWKTPNLTGGREMPNHHITSRSTSARCRSGHRWTSSGRRRRRCLATRGRLPARQQGLTADLGDAEVRQLHHQTKVCSGTKYVTKDSGSAWRMAALLAAVFLCLAGWRRAGLLLRRPRRRPFPRRPRRPPISPASSAACGRRLRRQGSDRRAAGRERPRQRASSCALLEDRLVVRAPIRASSWRSADETQPAADLLDPVTLKRVGSTPPTR
jgi:hypothetical protein